MPGTRKLGRETAHRTAMLRAMVTFLLENGKIETTISRAKEVSSLTEKFITLAKVENLASTLQVCLDSGAKKVLLPITAAADLSTVPSELIGCFNIIFYQSPEDAVFKALGVE